MSWKDLLFSFSVSFVFFYTILKLSRQGWLSVSTSLSAVQLSAVSQNRVRAGLRGMVYYLGLVLMVHVVGLAPVLPWHRHRTVESVAATTLHFFSTFVIPVYFWQTFVPFLSLAFACLFLVVSLLSIYIFTCFLCTYKLLEGNSKPNGNLRFLPGRNQQIISAPAQYPHINSVLSSISDRFLWLATLSTLGGNTPSTTKPLL